MIDGHMLIRFPFVVTFSKIDRDNILDKTKENIIKYSKLLNFDNGQLLQIDGRTHMKMDKIYNTVFDAVENMLTFEFMEEGEVYELEI